MRAVALIAVSATASCGRLGFEPGATDEIRDGSPDTPDTLDTTPNLMFVTSTPMPSGAFGGLAGADALCAARATAAGLPGTYVAWLSTSSVAAVDRLRVASGWTRVDGRPFANTADDVANGEVFYPPVLDELGAMQDSSAFTGTLFGGTVGANCNDFMSTTGSTEAGITTSGFASWGYGGMTLCTAARPIYCFGIDRQTSVVAPTRVGKRLAFITTGRWPPGGGLTDADATCNAEATTAGHTGTFTALLATSTATAVSRLVIAGPTWVRHDGVEIVPTPDALGVGALSANVEQAADGTRVERRVWTGSVNGFGSVGTDTCLDWTSGSSANFGTTGEGYYSNFRLWASGGTNCAGTGLFHDLLCFEN